MPNLIVSYNFNNNYNDSSGNGHHLTNNGSSFSSTNFIEGQAVEFDNTDYLEFPTTIDPYTIWNDNNGISFSVYFRFTSAPGTWSRLLDFQTGTGAHNGIIIAFNGNSLGNPELFCRFGSTDFKYYNEFSTNTIYHLVWTINKSGSNSTAWKIYLNGTDITGSHSSFVPPPNLDFSQSGAIRYINKSNFSSDGTWDGQMDNFRIYGGVLTSTQISNLNSHYDINDSNPSNWSVPSTDHQKFTMRHNSVKNYFNYLKQLGSNIYGPNAYSGFASVSLSSDGSKIAIGARWGHSSGTNYSGMVRVFEYSSGSWSQIGNDINGESAANDAGQNVSLSSDGTIVAVGAHNNDDNGNDNGNVRIFKWNGSSWNQLGSDIDGESEDHSGWSVSLSSDGTIVAIGAIRHDNNRGTVRVFEYNSGSDSWSQLGSDIDGEAVQDYSGWSVSLSNDGTIVAIGAIYNDGNGTNSGHVRVYKYKSSSSIK